MPNLPWPARRDVSAISDASLAALLSGLTPEDQSAGVQPAADVIAALRAAPAADELDGEALALAEFRSRRAGAPGPAQRARRARAARRGRPARRPSRMPARAAAAAAFAAIGAGGLATAAYAGVLPAPIQRFAHAAILAPAARATSIRADHPAAAGCQAPGRSGSASAAPARDTRPASALGMSASPAGAAPGRSAGLCRRATARPARRHVHRAGCWPAVPSPAPRPGASGSAAPRPGPTVRMHRPAADGPRPFRSCAAFWWRSHGQRRHWFPVMRPVPGRGSRPAGWQVPRPGKTSGHITSGPGSGAGAPSSSKPVQSHPNNPPSRQ
ncbi:MAG TPA: hypothetical protein VFV41_02830 [Streptosporangiaceae bacterium]|nr:hypothetical protein [Streptosporangiaceae bacterium]